MHTQNFPPIFTGLKIPPRFLGSLRAGAGGSIAIRLLAFLNGCACGVLLIMAFIVWRVCR